MSSSELPIVIVGAGISGLLTAQELKKAGLKVIVLEAAPVAGGRLLPSHALPKLKEKGFYTGTFKGDFDLQKEDPIDLGGELIHGDGTELFKFAASNDWKVRHVITWAQGDGETLPVGNGESFYWLGAQKRLISSLDVPLEHIKQINHLVGSLYTLQSNPNDGNTTIHDYLVSMGIPEGGEAMKLIDAGYANTYCSTLRTIKLRDTINCEKGFANDGEGEFRMGEPGHCLSSRVFATLLNGVDVRYNTWVAQINYPPGNNPVQIVTRDGETILASRVVLTVSPPLMQQLYFFPPLPLPKRVAIDTIKIENAMKVILFFNHRFWPETYQGIVCADSVVPEIWFDGNHYHPGILMDAKTKTPITESEQVPQQRKISRAVGFCCSQFANYLRSLPEEEAANKFKAQLNDIFGTPEEPEPATKYLAGYAIFCWGDMPNIRGGYTSPTVTEETRLELSLPVDDKLFFAGEATSFPTFTAAHCAMETAYRASREIIQSVASKQKARL